jgi:hypothetical protein
MLVGGSVVVLDSTEKLIQARFALLSGTLHVEQPRHPLGEEVLILQTRDGLAPTATQP